MNKKLKLKIAIVNFGMGNLYSIYNAFCSIGLEPQITSSRKDILDADGVILPGVGAFGKAMEKLRELQLIEDIYSKMNQYESLVEIVYVFDTPEYYTREKEKFLNHLNPFRGFFARLGIDIDTEFLRKEKLTEQFLDSLLNDSTVLELEE